MEAIYNYHVNANWEVRRNGRISAEGVAEPEIRFSAPVEFSGDRGHWTPEHFLIAAVVSCFVVTLSSMAEASKLKILSLDVAAEGQLGKKNGKLAFAEIVLRPVLTLFTPAGKELGERLLQKAEQGCLIARSLSCPIIMQAVVQADSPVPVV